MKMSVCFGFGCIRLGLEELDGPAVSALSVRSWKLSNVRKGQSMGYRKLLRASEGTLTWWSQPHLQSLAPINLNWARVVGYGLISLCVIHKEGLCPAVGTLIG
jgi:hypothetical protein